MLSSSRSDLVALTAAEFHCNMEARVGRDLSCSMSVMAGVSDMIEQLPLGLGPGHRPIEHALLPHIQETADHDRDIHHHLNEAKHLELAIDHRPGIKEDGLDVEQDKKN